MKFIRLSRNWGERLAVSVLLAGVVGGPLACRNMSRVVDNRTIESAQASKGEDDSKPNKSDAGANSADVHPSRQDVVAQPENKFGNGGVGDTSLLNPEDFHLFLNSRAKDPDGGEIVIDSDSVAHSEEEEEVQREAAKNDPRLTPQSPAASVASQGSPVYPEGEEPVESGEDLSKQLVIDTGSYNLDAPTDDPNKFTRRVLSKASGTPKHASQRPTFAPRGAKSAQEDGQEGVSAKDEVQASSSYNTSILFNGIVRDTNGVRISNSTVRLYSRLNSNYSWTIEDNSYSNSSGYYEVLFGRYYYSSDFPVIRDYRICAYSSGYPETCREYELRVNYEGDYTFDVDDIWLDGSGTAGSFDIAFYGSVHSGSANGVPVSGGVVTLYSRYSSFYDWHTESSGTTNGSGFFSLTFSRYLEADSYPYVRSYMVCVTHSLHQPTCTEARLIVYHAGHYTYEMAGMNPAYVAPAAPNLVSPIGEGDLAPRFSWSAAAGNSGYEFMLRDVANPTVNLYYVTGITGTSYQLPGYLNARNNYRWWVRSRNPYGFTAWSVPAVFTAKERVVTVAPTGDLPVIRPTFTWNALPGVVSYELWINNLTTNSIPFIQRVGLTGTSYTLDVPLKSGDQYSFSMRGKYAAGDSTLFSIGRKFRTGIPVGTAPIGPVLEVRPTYQWMAVESAIGYEVAIYDVSASPMTQLVRDTNISSNSYSPDLTLKVSRAYRWFVRAKFAGGAMSPWVYRNFSVARLPAPSIESPIGGFFVGKRPTVSWTDVPGAASYQIAINEYVGSSQVRRYDGAAATTPHTITNDLAAEKKYAVYVRGVTSQGAFGTWSKAITLTTLAVGIPVGISPTSSSNRVRPIFQWNAADLAVTYDIWMDDLSTGKNQILRLTGLSGNTYELTSDLLPKHSYRWYIRGVNLDGTAGRWSTKRAFVVNNALSLPVLTSPAANSQVEAKPLLSWGAVAGADRYEVRVVDSAGSIVFQASNVTVPSISLSDYLKVGTLYKWSVRARNANNEVSLWTPARSFTVKASFATPLPLAPLTGQVTTATPNFAWNPVLNAVSYEMRLLNVTQSLSVVYQDTALSVTEFEIPALVLNQGQKYRWSVRAISATGISSWSTSQDFTIGAMIDPPTLTGIVGAPTLQRPVISWSAVPGITQYQIYVLDRSTGLVVLNKRGISATDYAFTKNLVKNHTYRVLVRGILGTANGEWSVPREFKAQ